MDMNIMCEDEKRSKFKAALLASSDIFINGNWHSLKFDLKNSTVYVDNRPLGSFTSTIDDLADMLDEVKLRVSTVTW